MILITNSLIIFYEHYEIPISRFLTTKIKRGPKLENNHIYRKNVIIDHKLRFSESSVILRDD